MDNCKGCKCKGKLQACLRTDCSFHDDWVVARLLSEIKHLTEGIEEWNNYDHEHLTTVGRELDCLLVDSARQSGQKIVKAMEEK